jgi:homoserine kinase type II
MEIGSDRERFAPSELAVVLSHYDLGVIHSAKEFARGSRRSPKLLLSSDSGRFLLKRRAQGRDDPRRVEFAHALARHLRTRRFPAPTLHETRDGAATVLALDGRVYELFEFVDGERFSGSLDETMHAGRTLARFHRAIEGLESAWLPPPGGYHNADAVRSGLNAVPSTAASHDSVIGHEAELLALAQRLHECYDEAAEAAQNCGLRDMPVWIVHGDWHPGNVLFREGRVCAVLDFDSVRRGPQLLDVANGMLQFSILRGSGDPEHWPDFFDQPRMRRFLMGYASREPLEPAHRRAIPHLMIESLIGECVVPIAATGSFGRMPGFGVLQMVHRKVGWISENMPRLLSWMLE